MPSPVKEFEVGLGSMKVVRGRSILAISGIGSCVGLALRDAKCGMGGLAHVVLPESKEESIVYATSARYGSTAVRILARKLLSMRAEIVDMTAKLVGGAHVLSTGGFDGVKNIESVRKELTRMNIPIAAEDVGLSYGRSMKFDTGTGKITIRRFRKCNGIAELKDTIVI